MGFTDWLFGKKPVVPTMPVTTLGQGQQKAVSDNLAAEPGAAQIAKFTEDQLLSMMRSAIPGFDSMTSTASSNINDLLAGKIPEDVSTALKNSDAGRSLGSGTAGSGFSRDLVARDLGLTSLDLTSKGLSAAETWMSATERMLSPAAAELTSMFVTPGQEYSTTNEQNVQQFQAKWMQNQIDAMADPASPVAVIMKLCGRDQGAPSSAGVSPSSSGSGATNEWGWGGDAGTGAVNFGGAAANTGIGGAAEGVTIAG
jgi:hypothetical protein